MPDEKQKQELTDEELDKVSGGGSYKIVRPQRPFVSDKPSTPTLPDAISKHTEGVQRNG